MKSKPSSPAARTKGAPSPSRKSQSQIAIDSHSFSGRTLRAEEDLRQALLTIKSCAAAVNGQTGAISKTAAKAIQVACMELIHCQDHSAWGIDLLQGGGGISLHMAISEVILERARSQGQAELGIDTINASQSTADVCAAAFQLVAISRLNDLISSLKDCQDEWRYFSEAFGSVPKLARTCMQDAMVVRYSDYAQALITARQSEILRFKSCIKLLCYMGLGGTVIGSGHGASPAYQQKIVPALAKQSGIRLVPVADRFDYAQHLDRWLQVSAALRQCAISALKMARDLRLLSSGPRGGLGELVLPRILQGSSFFKDKSNPTVPETLIQACVQVQSYCYAADLHIQQGELDLNVFEAAACLNIIDGIRMMSAALRVFTNCAVVGLKVNKERCQELSSFARESK